MATATQLGLASTLSLTTLITRSRLAHKTEATETVEAAEANLSPEPQALAPSPEIESTEIEVKETTEVTELT